MRWFSFLNINRVLALLLQCSKGEGRKVRNGEKNRKIPKRRKHDDASTDCFESLEKSRKHGFSKVRTI